MHNLQTLYQRGTVCTLTTSTLSVSIHKQGITLMKHALCVQRALHIQLTLAIITPSVLAKCVRFAFGVAAAPWEEPFWWPMKV